MSDWQIGDLAVCISTASRCGLCETDESVAEGTVLTVSAVFPPEPDDEFEGLDFYEAPIGEDEGQWCACGFRKIRPDEHEACEEEFRTLLRRSRRTVQADA